MSFFAIYVNNKVNDTKYIHQGHAIKVSDEYFYNYNYIHIFKMNKIKDMLVKADSNKLNVDHSNVKLI